MTPCLDRLHAVRIVLVAPSHPGNIGGAARAMHTMGLARLVLVEPAALSRSRGRRARLGRNRRARRRPGRRHARRGARRLRARGGIVGAPARVRGARARRCARRPPRRSRTPRTATSRSCSAPRCRGCPTPSSRAAASSPRSRRIAGYGVAQSRCGGAGRRLRAARRGCGRRGLARAAFRARDRRRDRGAVRARHGDARRDALPRSAHAEAPAAAAAAALLARRAREGGGQHPARDPRPHRSAAEVHDPACAAARA